MFCVLVALTKNFKVFIHTKSTGNFDYKNFIVGYIAIPVFLFFFTYYKVVYRTKGVQASEADLYTGLAEVELHEREWAEKERADELREKSKFAIFYRRYVSWLF